MVRKYEFSRSVQFVDVPDGSYIGFQAENEQQYCFNSSKKLGDDLKVGPLNWIFPLYGVSLISFQALYKREMSNAHQHLVVNSRNSIFTLGFLVFIV